MWSAESFASAEATFFRPASKESKGAPTQRGSGSVEVLYCTNLLALTTNGVNAQTLLNSAFCSQPPLTLPLAVGGFSLHLVSVRAVIFDTQVIICDPVAVAKYKPW